MEVKYFKQQTYCTDLMGALVLYSSTFYLVTRITIMMGGNWGEIPDHLKDAASSWDIVIILTEFLRNSSQIAVKSFLCSFKLFTLIWASGSAQRNNYSQFTSDSGVIYKYYLFINLTGVFVLHSRILNLYKRGHIGVEGNWTALKESHHHPQVCWETFPSTARDEAGTVWTWIHAACCEAHGSLLLQSQSLWLQLLIYMYRYICSGLLKAPTYQMWLNDWSLKMYFRIFLLIIKQKCLGLQRLQPAWQKTQIKSNSPGFEPQPY